MMFRFTQNADSLTMMELCKGKCVTCSPHWLLPLPSMHSFSSWGGGVQVFGEFHTKFIDFTGVTCVFILFRAFLDCRLHISFIEVQGTFHGIYYS